MTMVMPAMLYMLETRLSNKKACPLLSCADIEYLLSHFLSEKDITEDEALRQMEIRHRQRQYSIVHAYATERAG